MELTARISNHFEQSGRFKIELAELLAAPIAGAAETIVGALLQDKKVLTCGNGGSAALAQYFASCLLHRYERERPSLAAVTLCADCVTLTSIANDQHLDYIYSKQVNALGQADDVLLVLSNSGNSPNILNAVTAARERGMHVIALSGGDGGSLVELLADGDIHIGVPHASPARIQETYILILHCLCDAIDCLLLGAN